MNRLRNGDAKVELDHEPGETLSLYQDDPAIDGRDEVVIT
jgi:hypothetical protein